MENLAVVKERVKTVLSSITSGKGDATTTAAQQ
jgi:hypothetical protein